MTETTILAAFDDAAVAETVVLALEAAGVPATAIRRHAPGEHVYDRAVERHGVVSVAVEAAHLARVTAILARHRPVHLGTT